MASKIPWGTIKTNIKSTLDAANTTTASPIYLSDGMDEKVQIVLKVHPDKIRVQSSLYPFVTVYADNKTISPGTIAKNQLSNKRDGTVELFIMGAVYEDNFASVDEDPADEEIENLMENVELALRGDSNLGGSVLWQRPTSITYHSLPFEEENHLRVGLMTLEAKVFY